MEAQLSRLDQVWPPPTREEVEAVRLPPTREVASENVFWVPRSLGIGDIDAAALLDLLLILDSMPLGFCPCELVSENSRAACLRSLWTFQLPRQPRTRARRRQRRSGGGRERGPPGDDGGGDGDGPPRPCSLFAGRRS